MIGYHYTTQEAWETIQQDGLYPHKIRQHEYDKFRLVLPKLQRDAIWVWKYPITDEQAFITTLTLASIHDSFEFVLLKIIYDDQDAASIVYRVYPDDIVKLSCSFGAGNLDTGKLPIELLVNPIRPQEISMIWEGDLLSPFLDHNNEFERCTDLIQDWSQPVLSA